MAYSPFLDLLPLPRQENQEKPWTRPTAREPIAFWGSIELLQRDFPARGHDSPVPSHCPAPSLPGQMEGSSFLIIKISAALKTRSLLLALQIIAFVREEQ